MSALALAIDVGGTKVEAALVTADGRVHRPSRTRRPTGGASTSFELEAAVLDAAEQATRALPAGAELVGIGIGSAGPVDLDRGLVSPLNLPAWRGYPLRDRVAELLPGIPVTLRVDGLCIALAEVWVGAAVGARDAMAMIVSTGVGGGLVLGGHAMTGATGNAGHIGHIEVSGFDDPCPCGGRGCLEAVASGPRTVAWARENGFEGATGEDLAAAHAVGDPIALAAVRRAGTAIGRAVGSATALVDLEVAVIGGGFSRVSPVLFEHARAAVAERTVFDFVTKVRILPSGLGHDGPLIGAGALVHRPDLVGSPGKADSTAQPG